LVFLAVFAVFAVFFGLGWLVGGSGVGGWGGREWVEWMDGGSGDLCFWRGESGWGEEWSGGCWLIVGRGGGDVCLEWVDVGFVNIRNTVLGLINETLSALIDYYIYIYIFLGSEHHRVYIPYIARIHRCKRLWCSMCGCSYMGWGFGGEKCCRGECGCSGGICLGKTELEKKLFDYAEGRRLLLLFVR